jgi:hypothetical protein
MIMMLITHQNLKKIIRWQSGDIYDVDYHQNLKNNQVMMMIIDVDYSSKLKK